MPKKQRLEPLRTPLTELATELGYSLDTIQVAARNVGLGVKRQGVYLTDAEADQLREILASRRKYGERRA